MNIDTDKAHGFLFQVQAHLRWPSIAKKRRIQFPLSQIGNVSVSIADNGYKRLTEVCFLCVLCIAMIMG